MRMPGRGCKDEQIVQEGSADAPLPGVVRVAPFNRLKPGLETGCFTVRSSEGPGDQRRNMQGVVQGVPWLALMGCGDRLLPHQEQASPTAWSCHNWQSALSCTSHHKYRGGRRNEAVDFIVTEAKPMFESVRADPGGH